MKVYIGADHRGFPLKEKIKVSLQDSNTPFEDLGNAIFDPEDDFPVFAQLVAQHVAKDADSRGIVICGSGVGVDIAANKVNGIRSGLVVSTEQARSARQDDDINVLALAADFIQPDELNHIIKAFLETPYNPSQKHTRRVAELQTMENE